MRPVDELFATVERYGFIGSRGHDRGVMVVD